VYGAGSVLKRSCRHSERQAKRRRLDGTAGTFHGFLLQRISATLPLEAGFKSSDRSNSDVLSVEGHPDDSRAADLGRALAQDERAVPPRPTTHSGCTPLAYNPSRSWVSVYGVAALTFMMVMYWLEHRGPVFILGFALGCLSSSIYGFLAGAWPFGVLEAGRGEIPA
jgi:hypothetical protein